MADDNGGGGVPGWFVTFSDIMALLLTFFIMLVSFSELKSEEKYQSLMDSFQQQFGNHDAAASVMPGQLRPRNSALSRIASAGRAKRQDILHEGAKVQALVGDSDLAAMVRPGKRTNVGTILYFQENQIELDDDQRSLLRQQAEQLRGKPQKLEIRGHTSLRPSQTGTHVRDNWDLSFERCRRVMQYLVEEQRIDSRTLRISAAAANEPLHIGTDHAQLPRNPRVELYLLDEVVNETTGTEED